METIVERPAGLDVHKAQVTACVRAPATGEGREEHFAEFATTVPGLLTLRDWLAAHRVTQVTMEATGCYWKPVWAILEDEFDCVLVNARHVKQVPGRKTDVSDAAWICRLAEAGLLRASFVPPKPIRALRNLTRYRKTQIQEPRVLPQGGTQVRLKGALVPHDHRQRFAQRLIGLGGYSLHGLRLGGRPDRRGFTMAMIATTAVSPR